MFRGFGAWGSEGFGFCLGFRIGVYRVSGLGFQGSGFGV